MTTAYGDLIPGAGFANRVTYIIGADGKVAFVDKNVNGHLNTCGADWAAWVKAHPAIKSSATASTAACGHDAGTATHRLDDRCVAKVGDGSKSATPPLLSPSPMP